MSVYTLPGHISKPWISMEWIDKWIFYLVPFQARCEPPIRPAITSSVQIEEIEDIQETIDEQTMSPLMQERMKRMRDYQEIMVDGIPVPKKKAKAQPKKAQEGTGSSSSKD